MSFKKHGHKLPDSDTFRNVYLRHLYGGIYLNKLFENKKLIVYDESSFSTLDFAAKSWYFKGQTLYKKKCRIAYRVSLIAACDTDGGVYASFLQGNSAYLSTTLFLT